MVRLRNRKRCQMAILRSNALYSTAWFVTSDDAQSGTIPGFLENTSRLLTDVYPMIIFSVTWANVIVDSSSFETGRCDVGELKAVFAIEPFQQLDFTQAQRALAVVEDFDRVAGG